MKDNKPPIPNTGKVPPNLGKNIKPKKINVKPVRVRNTPRGQ